MTSAIFLLSQNSGGDSLLCASWQVYSAFSSLDLSSLLLIVSLICGVMMKDGREAGFGGMVVMLVSGIVWALEGLGPLLDCGVGVPFGIGSL